MISMNALEKFMDSFGITYTIEIARTYRERVKPVCCLRILVERKGQPEYLQYHCYSLKSNGDLKYVEGNEIKGIHQGVLAYLGMDREIDNYFDLKAREIAKDYLIENS